MWEILVTRQPALLIPILSVVGSALVFLVWIVAHYWAKIRRLELEASLKRDMINRGLGAADIERVLLASSTAAPASLAEQDRKRAFDQNLIMKMIAGEYSGEEIERLVRALKTGEGTEVRLPDRLLG